MQTTKDCALYNNIFCCTCCGLIKLCDVTEIQRFAIKVRELRSAEYYIGRGIIYLKRKILY